MRRAILALLAFHALPLAALAVEPLYELRVELYGNVYIADTGLTATDCENAIDGVASVQIDNVQRVYVPIDAPIYCVAY